MIKHKLSRACYFEETLTISVIYSAPITIRSTRSSALVYARLLNVDLQAMKLVTGSNTKGLRSVKLCFRRDFLPICSSQNLQLSSLLSFINAATSFIKTMKSNSSDSSKSLATVNLVMCMYPRVEAKELPVHKDRRHNSVHAVLRPIQTMRTSIRD